MQPPPPLQMPSHGEPGKGAKFNEPFLDPPANIVSSITPDTLLYGKTYEEVKASFAEQIIGERLNIRMIFIFPLNDSDKDPGWLDLVKEFVQRVAAEQGCGYSDIHVGLLRKEITVFKEVAARKGEVTDEDIQRYLHEAAATP